MSPFISAAFGAVTGSIITHGFTSWREHKKERDRLIGTCYSVCFSLAMYLSELGGLLKEIEYRSAILQKVKSNELQRDQYISIFQDFIYVENINIDIGKISEIIFPAGGNYRGIAGILQDVFISNKKYLKILAQIKRFNEAKRIASSETTDMNILIQNLLKFSDLNFPGYIQQIKQDITFITQTFDAFKMEIKDKLNITINLSMGPVVKIN